MARIICVVLLVALVTAEQENEGGKCERIRLPLCQDLGYNWTAMPNLLGHKDQKEAEEAMSVYGEVLSSGCGEHARFVVCSAFAPLCSEEVSGAVSACREVCEAAVGACAGRLRLDCGAFPHRPDRRLCMHPPNGTAGEPDPSPPATAHTPPRWPLATRDDSAAAGAGAGCGAGQLRAPTGDCWPRCPPRGSALDSWLAALAWLSLASTSFALVTFCAEPARYRYPERPAVWMAACHAGVAVAHVARAWLGPAGVACAGGALAVDGVAARAPGCVAFFAVTHYLALAADAWFANACVAWYLTAASEWSTEALERGAAYLHAAAWGWAGAWTAAALALRRVAADAVTGTCGVAPAGAAALEGVPRAALLAAGAALAAAAAPGVARVRRALGGRGAARVGRLAARAAAAGALYLVVAGAGAAARVVEARHESGAGASLVLRLVLGAVSGAWAWSRKSGVVWRRALCPPRKAPPCAPLLRAHPAPVPYKRAPTLPVSRV